MIPAAFEYHRPATLQDAIALLGRLGGDAKVLAGGQSLIPLMKLRLASPRHVVDVNRIPGLGTIANFTSSGQSTRSSGVFTITGSAAA